MADIITQHRRLLDTNLKLEFENETIKHEYNMLVQMVADTVQTSLRDIAGTDWRKAFPEKSKALRHFQALHHIARYLKLKSPPS